MSNEQIKKMYVEEYTVRIIAFQVIVLTALILYAKSYWLALALGIDFAIRAFTFFPSPLAAVAKMIRKRMRWANKPVFAPPKKFAATMGFAFSLAIFALFYFQQAGAAYIVGGVLLACAGLESFFNVCVGCYVYDWVIAPFKN